jgi:endonuclease G
MSFATFVMTNVIPQAGNVNEKAWANLEEYGRRLVAQQHMRLYIVAGPAGRGGRGTKGYATTIADGRVAVPAQCWKVIVAVPESGTTGSADELSRIDASARVIAVIMPNDDQRVGDNWARFRTSPAAVEALTGYHFFAALPPAVAQRLRQKVDTAVIAPVEPYHHSR